MSFDLFEGFIESSPYVEKIKAFEKYFTSQIDLYDKVYNLLTFFFVGCIKMLLQRDIFSPQDEIERKGSILVDYKDMLANKPISTALPDLAHELKDMPEKILDCLGLAIHQVHAWSLPLGVIFKICGYKLNIKCIIRKGLLFNLDDEINLSLLCFYRY